MSEIDGTALCVECDQQTDKICSWCSVPICERHRYDVPVHWMTPGGMPAGISLESYCESCMADEEEEGGD